MAPKTVGGCRPLALVLAFADNAKSMAREIERKFLVIGDAWRAEADAGTAMRQGYVFRERQKSLRVRVAGTRARLTFKAGAGALDRLELEFDVPIDDARNLIDHLCDGRVVDKTRYRVPVGRHVFEVDVFAGRNDGLIVAELELDGVDEQFTRPAWLGREVTDDPRYLNANLAVRPWSKWRDEPDPA
jgi:adenylate cyclase